MIALPLAAVSIEGLGMNQLLAETVAPVAAVELLARSKSADAKCRYLADEDRQELADYVARGEIAAAERHGVGVARSAIESGQKRGETTLCGPESRAEVEATLAAAREAMTQAELRASLAPEPSVRAENKRERIAAKPEKKLREKPAVASAPEGIDAYARQAMAYYVERRCGHLSRREANNFWKRIVVRHQHVLSRHGAGPVKAALRQAESAAAAKTCGTKTAALVKQSYAALRQ